MPRKTKENKEIEKQKKTIKSNSKTTSKKSSTSAKKTTAKKTASKKETTSTKKTATKKSSTSTNKTKAKKSQTKKEPTIMEYYDLPYKYNQTLVKVLAQTPTTLFIYWEISDEDIENYKQKYGEDFFETTKPILIIHNTTLNYSFEVEINDFANSWYLHIDNSKSEYNIELGRRPIQYNENIKTDYIYFASSNAIEAPNDHILLNPSQKDVAFRNIKTNQQFQKEISTFSFIKNFGKPYKIYDFYKDVYNDINLSSSKFI